VDEEVRDGVTRRGSWERAAAKQQPPCGRSRPAELRPHLHGAAEAARAASAAAVTRARRPACVAARQITALLVFQAAVQFRPGKRWSCRRCKGGCACCGNAGRWSLPQVGSLTVWEGALAGSKPGAWRRHAGCKAGLRSNGRARGKRLCLEGFAVSRPVLLRWYGWGSTARAGVA